jgi:2-keto-4-pentenoate hydratase/2-oxohepta-3-ene-1,7-dioic acid hydratase in catechol pathway
MSPPTSSRPSRLGRRLSVHDPRRPLGPGDLTPDEGPSAVPRIVRFVANDGTPRIGLVLEAVQGRPRRILDLTARHRLGPGLLELVDAGGFEIAARELERYASGITGTAREEPELVTLEPEELPYRLLSPVDIDADQLERGARLVVGFGLTFRAHRHETGDAPPFVFPKPAVPTGAYAPVVTGGDTPSRPIMLLDYELELGCVALRDIELDRLDLVDSATDFAYVAVNDVTAREPILRDRRAGFARAKGRPTYLPVGPWVVPGPHFTRDEPALLRMVLTVDEGMAHEGTDGSPVRRRQTLRQDARLEELTLGVGELLALLARQRNLTMPGTDGRAWPVSIERAGRRIVPAGSLLLTGTPGGTAIRAPGRIDRLSLLMRGLRYLRWPAEDYRRHLEEHRHSFGFLSPGDRVSGWITGLGRQEWSVR